MGLFTGTNQVLDDEDTLTEWKVRLYHERWEIELGCDEIRTEHLGREEAIRSLSVRGVKQVL